MTKQDIKGLNSLDYTNNNQINNEKQISIETEESTR